jgi:hypothetical protein
MPDLHKTPSAKLDAPLLSPNPMQLAPQPNCTRHTHTHAAHGTHTRARAHSALGAGSWGGVLLPTRVPISRPAPQQGGKKKPLFLFFAFALCFWFPFRFFSPPFLGAGRDLPPPPPPPYSQSTQVQRRSPKPKDAQHFTDIRSK